MQFIKDNEWLKVSRVTGPSHNFLGLVVGNEGSRREPIVEAMPPQKGVQARLLEQDIRQHVEAGIAEANRAFGTKYFVSRIQFVPTDTPPASTYKGLARSIIERLVTSRNGF